MSGRRVVITGVGLTTPIGHDLGTVREALKQGRHGIATTAAWSHIGQLQTRLAAEARDVPWPDWPRKKVRSMGRVALLAAYATHNALADAGITQEQLDSGDVGLAYGSTHGSSTELEAFCKTLFETNGLAGIAGSSYLKFMSHTCAANLAMFYGVRGRIIPTCAACASASQAIGYGYESVKYGMQEVMICGGAEEMHFVHAGVFDIMYATSTRYNEAPDRSPRPFDAERDGLVVGEGAGTVIVESYERARARGAHIYAEILGFGTNCDGTHVTSPSAEGMAGAMRRALRDARVEPGQVNYINAHATATTIGDVAESHATRDVMGSDVPISSTKGFTGHTLGACGAIEVAFCLEMMREGFLAPNRNLERVDPECAPLAYVQGDPREARVDIAMTNNFAFGGINTSLILKRV